ncbi:MAG TPA: tol-pal system protein YbgF [Geobacteraceae bacterium]
MGVRFWLCGAVFCLAASGCGNNDMLLKKQTEMDARLEQLIQGNAGTNARLAEMGNELKDLQDRVKAHSADLDELKPGFRDLKSSLEGVSQRAEGRGTQPAASRIVVVNKGGSAADHDSAEQDAYMKAFGLFSTNNYPGAIEAFDAFIANYPGSEYAGNAQYWIGECYYTQRDYTKALDAFTRVVDRYPKGKKVPDAMLKIGFSLISLNQHDKARTALETLVEKYPKSQAALKARERLSHN